MILKKNKKFILGSLGLLAIVPPVVITASCGSEKKVDEIDKSKLTDVEKLLGEADPNPKRRPGIGDITLKDGYIAYRTEIEELRTVLRELKDFKKGSPLHGNYFDIDVNGSATLKANKLSYFSKTMAKTVRALLSFILYNDKKIEVVNINNLSLIESNFDKNQKVLEEQINLYSSGKYDESKVIDLYNIHNGITHVDSKMLKSIFDQIIGVKGGKAGFLNWGPKDVDKISEHTLTIYVEPSYTEKTGDKKCLGYKMIEALNKQDWLPLLKTNINKNPLLKNLVTKTNITFIEN